MQSRKRNIVSRIIGATLCVASMNFAFSSCEKIYEDLDPCAHGVSLRFIYDYNMEFANAFPKKVDCLTLYIYGEEGNHVGTRVVTGPELRDEGFRMTLDLEPGNYTGGWLAGKVLFPWYGHRNRAASIAMCGQRWMWIV